MRVFHRNPPPLREVIGKSMRNLRFQQNRIEQVSFKLKKRGKALFQTCIHALKGKNKDRATMCANEIAEIKRLIKFLYNVELAIERVILRLETISELNDIIMDLKPALSILQSVSKQLFEVLPDVSSELNRVNDVINETLYSTRATADGLAIPVNKTTQGGEEVLEEVSSFLEREISERFPEPPVSVDIPDIPVKQMIALATTCSQQVSQETVQTEAVSSRDFLSFKKAEIQELSLKVEESSLEDVVLEYVKKSKGEVDLLQCSVELDASYNEIERALQNLGVKGKVEIKTRVK